jgi:DNA-binding beta-propeller fold protein YncE
MSTSTRRGFLGGAVAAAPVLARATEAGAATAPAAKRKVVRRGRAIAVSTDGRRLVVAHDLRHTVAIVTRGRRRIVDVGGQPVAVAVAPSGAVAAVATASWDGPGLTIVDLASGVVRARRKLGPAPSDVAFTPDGRRLLVAGGEQEGTLRVLETAGYATVAHTRPGRVPRAIAVTADGRHAWLTLTADDRIVLVDLETGRVRRELRTPALPDRLALSPDGRRMLVSHLHDDHVSEIHVEGRGRDRHPAGRHPSAVAWTANGKRLVALGGDGAVLLVSGRRYGVDAAPRGLAVAGRRFWTVSAITGAVGGGRV